MTDRAPTESTFEEQLPQLTCLSRCDTNGSRFIVVMATCLEADCAGVSGTGKSTLGAALAKLLQVPFIDGDDLHPSANVAKMARGEPLDDRDRAPWLDAIRKRAVARASLAGGDESAAAAGTLSRRPSGGVVVVVAACSALKKRYRDVLRASGMPTYFVYLKGERDVLMARLLDRQGHFMKAGMLESQLGALESPEGEPGVVSVPVGMSTEEQVRRVVEVLEGWQR